MGVAEMKGNRLNYYVKYVDKWWDNEDTRVWIIYRALVNLDGQRFYTLMKNFACVM